MDARMAWRRIKRDYGPYLPLSPYLFVVLFPFYWMVITAFKRDRDLYNLETAPFWFKEPPTLDHVRLLLEGTLFLKWLQNSLMIGVLVVIITLLLALPAAYALARMRFPGAQPLSTAMFLSYLIPSTLLFIPVIVPGIITAGIFAFTLTYQEFIYALTFISASANKTISYGVTSDLVRGDVFYWGSLMSGALIGAVPVAIVYAFSLDHFIHGLTAGALK